MKRKILIGNWKMNKTIAETIDFVNKVNPKAIEVAKENTVEKMAEAHKNIFLELEHENNLHNNRN